MFKKILAVLSAAILLTVTGCGKSPEKEENTNTEDTTQTETAEQDNTETENETEEDIYSEKILFTIEMEDGGIMKGELYPKVAPITVENFVSLCNEKFYDGLIFHRVIPGFMIQGGGYDENMKPKTTASIKGEFDSNGVDNPLKHERGVISMARTQEPNSASSQFFIMHETSPHLDGEYAAFGKITEGLDIIDEIASVQTDVYQNIMEDVPVEPQIIKTIRIDK